MNKSEIQNLIQNPDTKSLLDSNKSVGPNSLPKKILNLLKNDISRQLADIFNISFSTGVLKKTPNWTFQTICQFHYYLILKRY